MIHLFINLTSKCFQGYYFEDPETPSPLVLQQLDLSPPDCWSHVCVLYFSVRRLPHLCATLNLQMGLVT